jgi:hypothetical protein
MLEKEYHVLVNNVFKFAIHSKNLSQAFRDFCSIMIYDQQEFEGHVNFNALSKELTIKIVEAGKEQNNG